jgi:hypothetical protein
LVKSIGVEQEISRELVKSVYVCGTYPDILSKDTSPKDILPNGHFADRHFVEQTFLIPITSSFGKMSVQQMSFGKMSSHQIHEEEAEDENDARSLQRRS